MHWLWERLLAAIIIISRLKAAPTGIFHVNLGFPDKRQKEKYKLLEGKMVLSPSLIWFLVGVAFLLAELAVPGFILIFFTAGCWIAALATWVFDIEVTRQILIFVVSSLTLLFTLRKYSLKVFKGKIRDDVDDHYMDSKIGKTAIVTKTIGPNLPGEIKVMGSFWRAVAEMEIEEGQSVLIESQASEDGLTFRVKPL